METWFIIVSTLCIAALIKALFNLVFLYRKYDRSNTNLPPGPPTIPIIGNAILLGKSFYELESNLRNVRAKLGNIVTLRIGPYPIVFVCDHSLAHQALVQKGSFFGDRPSTVSIGNQHTINSARYGQTWSVLRKNLTSEILNPSRVRSYSHARKWVLNILKEQLLKSKSGGQPVRVVDHFRYAMFCLLALMCFGDKLDEEQIRRIEDVQRDLVTNLANKNKIEIEIAPTEAIKKIISI
ncbi:cytochrome P450 89A2-like [Hibiscus syriacus]|uniref:cytochrome P450 89A2-like n=1 Tax=Hibiscus syriacus TaxID=106335 RepID=UPI0019249E3B|nr:cytochrome P450 89A2-like [Hibiscus syriacus]